MQKVEKYLETLLDAYREQAPQSAEYPYKVFSLQTVSVTDGLITAILEVNIWDSYKTYSRVSTKMDELEKAINQKGIITQDFFIMFYKGTRQNVEDPDKNIKRTREQFEVHIRLREE